MTTERELGDTQEIPVVVAPTNDPRRRRRMVWDLRTRVLTALVGLAAAALVAAGTTAYGIERDRLDARIDDSLRRTAVEVGTLAETGVDPTTGLPFASADSLVATALARFVPANNEAALTFGVEGWTAASTLNLAEPEQDGTLMSALVDTPSETWIRLDRAVTDTADWRYVVVPVQAGESSTAALVVTFDRGAELSGLHSTFRMYTLVAALAVLTIAVAGWLVLGRIMEPIRLVRRTAEEISSSDLSSRVPVVGDDELADLTVTINEMLDRLDATFSAQRRLLDDVGHELRTPLTVVRGHLELMDTSDPDDTTATRTLALDEIDRMYRLVDDLVTLAKSESPDFVRPRPVDIAVLIDEVLAKARSLGDRRWRLDALAEGEADLDPQRVTQALLQLASNAVAYSDEGSTVALGSAHTAQGLEMWVRDEGVGIPEDEQAQVFERFARASTGWDRRDGTGLGLPIVQSIAASHGGAVRLVSAVGRGTTVSLVLPAARVHDVEEEGEE